MLPEPSRTKMIEFSNSQGLLRPSFELTFGLPLALALNDAIEEAEDCEARAVVEVIVELDEPLDHVKWRLF